MDSFIFLGDLCPSLTGGRMGGAGGKYEHPFSKGLCELICVSNWGETRDISPLCLNIAQLELSGITGNPAAPAPQGN